MVKGPYALLRKSQCGRESADGVHGMEWQSIACRRSQISKMSILYTA